MFWKKRKDNGQSFVPKSTKGTQMKDRHGSVEPSGMKIQTTSQQGIGIRLIGEKEMVDSYGNFIPEAPFYVHIDVRENDKLMQYIFPAQSKAEAEKILEKQKPKYKMFQAGITTEWQFIKNIPHRQHWISILMGEQN